MPIRRAAVTPPQETPPKSNQDGDPDASSEESGSAEEEQEAVAAPAETPPKEAEEPVDAEEADKEEAAETDEKPPEETPEEGQGEKEGEKDAGKEESEKEKEKDKEKVKKVKRTIPSWATMSASRRALVQKTSVSLYSQPKMDDIFIEAIKACKDKASAYAIRKYITKNYASLELDRRAFLLKKSLKRLLEKGAIKQLKGKGLSGSFSIVKQTKTTKASGKKAAAATPLKTETLGDTLPLIMTHLCEPKEASYILIKKYMEQHFPQFNVEQRPDLLKSALQRSVEKGHLEQLTGKGASGTFQIKRASDKPSHKGGPLEDAILTAITAMNEPKTCSISIMRKFLLEKHKDSRVPLLLNNLKRTLKTCKMRGWMEQISGTGFSGTYQLCYPFYPSPALLFPEKHAKEEKPKRKRETKEESSDEEESEEEEEEEEESEEESESEEEPPSKKRKQQKRPPPKVRRPPPAKKSQSRSRGGSKRAKAPARSPAKEKKLNKSAKKRSGSAQKPTPSAKKAAPPAKRSAPPPRRSAPPAKKPVPPAKKPASAAKASASEQAAPPSKAAPAAKPKTPVAKKMTSKAPKRLSPKRPPPKAAAAPKSAVKAKPASSRPQRSRK